LRVVWVVFCVGKPIQSRQHTEKKATGVGLATVIGQRL
jgi:hypothetical protein